MKRLKILVKVVINVILNPARLAALFNLLCGNRILHREDLRTVSITWGVRLTTALCYGWPGLLRVLLAGTLCISPKIIDPESGKGIP